MFCVTNIPRKKTSLGESLAGSHAYNPIRDSRRDSWRDFLTRKVLPTVCPRVLPRVLLRVLPRLSVRLLARLLARLFAPKGLAKSLGESLASDYMQDSRRDSPRLVFFTRVTQNLLKKWNQNVPHSTNLVNITGGRCSRNSKNYISDVSFNLFRYSKSNEN